MKRIQDWLNKYFVPGALKFSKNDYVQAIQHGVMGSVGVLTIGGLLSIIQTPPITGTPTGIMLAWKNFSMVNAEWLNVATTFSMKAIALYAVVGIAFSLARSKKLPELNAMVTALVSFFILSVKLTKVDGFGDVMTIGSLSSGGLFTAIIVGLSVVALINFFTKKGIKLKMPEAVPANVAAPFEALIATLAVVLISIGIRVFLAANFKIMFPDLISVILRPILVAGDSLPVLMLAMILMRTLWSFGIHGTSIVMAPLYPILIANTIENVEAYSAGLPIPNIFAAGFFSYQLGMMPAAIWMLMFAKSGQLKAVGKVGIVPGIFQISEPIHFGTPFVMNPILIFPHVFNLTMNWTIAYLIIQSGLVAKPIFQVPNFMPGFLSVFMSSLDWKSVVLWAGLVALNVVIYAPFLRAYDNNLVNNEEKA